MPDVRQGSLASAVGNEQGEGVQVVDVSGLQPSFVQGDLTQAFGLGCYVTGLRP